MPAKTAAQLGATDWWDTGYSLNTGAGTWAGKIAGTVMEGFGKPFPGSFMDSSVGYTALNFTANTATRTPLSATYNALFAGNCTLVVAARMRYENGVRILCAGRTASWNDLGYGVITMGADSASGNAIFGQMYDYGGSNATSMATVTGYALFALRKSGTTLQVLAVGGSSTTIQASAYSGTAPNVTDASYFSVGNHHSNTSQGVGMDVFQAGFFPYVLSDQDFLDLRDGEVPWVPHPVSVTLSPDPINGTSTLTSSMIRMLQLGADALNGESTISNPNLVRVVTLSADGIVGIATIDGGSPTVNVVLQALALNCYGVLSSNGMFSDITLVPASPPLRGRTVFTNPTGGLVSLVSTGNLRGTIQGDSNISGSLPYANHLTANQIFGRARLVSFQVIREFPLVPMEIP